ncbi:SHOCT domain-containing protein [Thiohalorhabdus sp.]|uniref:SHOCT domain-containing protein n=1 Tax=Thiohalorhabdus sp. TaxID=3094134 RepID=UPI002FC291B9
MMGNGGFGMGFGGPLIWILVIVVLVALVPWVVRQGSQNSAAGGGGAGSNRALEVLKERYARGEIDREEYQRKRTDLEE